MSVNLWWAENDGMSGHVWLAATELRALGAEMLARGMAREGGADGAGPGIPLAELVRAGREGRVAVADVEHALAAAGQVVPEHVEPTLWRDWLRFLEGAAAHGGIVAR